MAAPGAVTPSHAAMPDCPSHGPASDEGTPLPRGPHQTPPCCALSPASRISALPEPAATATSVALRVPAPSFSFAVPVATSVSAVARSSPVRSASVSAHLLFSVFLV